jgi:type IV/VI secretion system ImpK/VasF family protein
MADENIQRRGSLARLYEEIITAVVHKQRQGEVDATGFRERIKTDLRKVDQKARPRGIDPDDVHDAHLAVVAFADEAILAILPPKDPARDNWIPMAQEAITPGVPVAGEAFFIRLDLLLKRRGSENLANLLEVYLLCLRLGFRGTYAENSEDLKSVTERTRLREELKSITESTRLRIDQIRQPVAPVFAPGSYELGESSEPPPVTPEESFVPFAALAIGILVLLLFIAFKAHLLWTVSETRQIFLQS